MKTSIEYCTGRLEAFKEVGELLSMIRTNDKTTLAQLKILIDHCTEVVNFEERAINVTLELMEGCSNGSN